ncbi:MAG: ribbon-helix-helix domain-containing protein [Firmicutes bacterium]|nr:ribbon-helix-helix domain-containing protein [Bacillota bacterium]
MAGKTVQVQLPESLAHALEQMVHEGWFVSEEEAIREALREFVSSRLWQLAEQFLLEDIEWAVNLKTQRG